MQNRYETKRDQAARKITKMLVNMDLERGAFFDSLVLEGVESREAGLTYRAIEMKLEELIHLEGKFHLLGGA